MKTVPVSTAYAPSYYAKTRQTSMRKLPLIAAGAEAAGYARLVAPTPVTREQLELIHDPGYVDSILTGHGPLATSAFGFWSEPYRDGVLAINGGNLCAAELALAEGIAANVGQGFHHAHADRGEGFCTFNGLALVAALHPDRRVLVIDCDEHEGNGTAEFTETLPNLTTFSIYGSWMGGRASARASQREVRSGDAAAYRGYLHEALELAATSRPDLVIYQAGMDPHEDDPLGRAAMTSAFLAERDRLVMETLALDLRLPFFFVVAGGYQEPLETKLVPLHVQTFAIAAQVAAQLAEQGAAPQEQTR